MSALDIPGFSALQCVISSLRDTAHFTDEEGDLTDKLRDLRDWVSIRAAVQAAQPEAVGDGATIAGLESAVGHLSTMVDEQRRLLVEVEQVCGRDAYGMEFEDGDSELIDKVRAHLAATTSAPTPEPMSAPTEAKPAQDAVDAELLDWLEAQINEHGAIHLHDGNNPNGHGLGLRPGSLNRTLRDAIRAAISAKKGGA